MKNYAEYMKAAGKIIIIFIVSVISAESLYADDPVFLMPVELVTEVYDKVDEEPNNQQLGGVLLSVKPQIIWKLDNALLLLSLQIYGYLGETTSEIPEEAADPVLSYSGSFSSQDLIGIALKPDSFYQSTIRDSDLYFKVGKYTTEIPFLYGGDLVSGQFEFGIRKTDKYRIYTSSIFYNWFTTDIFEQPDQKIIQLLAMNLWFGEQNISLYYPFLINNAFLEQYHFPSVQWIFSGEKIRNDVFGGFSYHKNLEGESGYSWAVREEAGIRYGEAWRTSIMYSFLSASDTVTNNYAFTSVDAQTPYLSYGHHFDYIYEVIGNIYGLHSAGIHQAFSKEDLSWWLESAVFFTALPSDSASKFAGVALRGDMKLFNLWNSGSILEIYGAVLFPGSFSQRNLDKTYNPGYQLLIKLQQNF